MQEMNPYAPPQTECESSLQRTMRRQVVLHAAVLALCVLCFVASVAMTPIIWWYYTPLAIVGWWLVRRSWADLEYWRAQRRMVCDTF